jgi:hypothetical protein
VLKTKGLSLITVAIRRTDFNCKISWGIDKGQNAEKSESDKLSGNFWYKSVMACISSIEYSRGQHLMSSETNIVSKINLIALTDSEEVGSRSI